MIEPDEVIDLVCAQADVEWTEVSITDDPRLAQRYADEIPVVLVDGRVHDIYLQVGAAVPLPVRSAVQEANGTPHPAGGGKASAE